MGEIRINLSNVIAVGLMGFIGVWAINKGLRAAGKPEWAV